MEAIDDLKFSCSNFQPRTWPVAGTEGSGSDGVVFKKGAAAVGGSDMFRPDIRVQHGMSVKCKFHKEL